MPWTYDVSVNYWTEQNIIHEPLAVDPDAAGDSCAFIALGAPYGKKVVQFVVASEGKLPPLPSQEPASDNEVLLSVSFNPNIPAAIDQYSGRGQYIIQGTYIYGLKEPPTEEEGYETGLPPYYIGNVRVVYNSSKFRKGVH